MHIQTPQIYKTGVNEFALVFENVNESWSGSIMLSSDRHHDNRYCRRDLEKKHLEKAARKSGSSCTAVLDFGDLFCAMLGKWDPRSDMKQLLPEYQRNDYLNALIEHATSFYLPYSHLIKLIARGNHETAIIDRRSFDLTGDLVEKINQKTGERVFSGGYTGAVHLFFRSPQETLICRKTLRWYHGKGSGGGSYDNVNIRQYFTRNFPDADYFVSGHTHDAWVMASKSEFVGQTHSSERKIQWHIKCPGYKDEYPKDGMGWAIEKGHNLKPLGCVWMDFRLENGRICEYVYPEVE